MAEEGSGTPAAPKRQLFYTYLLAVTIAAGGVWFGWSWYNLYWTSRDSGTAAGEYALGIRLCRLELQLRSVAVRDFVARTGRLPQSLAECDCNGLHIDDWLLWGKDNYRAGDDWELAWTLEYGRGIIWEPWLPEALRLNDPQYMARLPYGPRPSAAQDLFGLPVVYVTGRKPKDDLSWIGSSDPLPPEVEKFVSAQGPMPPPAANEFALSSLFVRGAVRHLDDVRRMARLALVLFLGGSAFFVAVAIGTIVKWRRTGTEKPEAATIVAAGLIAAVAAFFGWAGTRATCYLPASFSSTFLPRAQRLELLDKAVKQGEIPQDVAKVAREYIETLPNWGPMG